MEKFYNALRSQGLSVGKNTLHEYLAHIEDAFLVRTVSLHTASERQRMVNPRKAYPVDPGLIPVYECAGRASIGRALETAVLLELERRGCDVGYVRTDEGYEVDFHARDPEGRVSLTQVSADVGNADTWHRGARALVSAARQYPGSTPVLLTADAQPPAEALPAPLVWQPAAAWLLGDGTSP
ncbi:MAG: ATP-binding protein [Lentisphaerae bacterium]|nr:ATP-binding protein [Lentisphaerota bacterium]